MNPLQVMGIIAGCVALFVGVVTALTLQGVPVLIAFLGVYLFAVCFMLGMQRRARDSSENAEFERRRRGIAPLRETHLPGSDAGDRHASRLPEQFRA